MKNSSKILLLCLTAGLAVLPGLRADDAPPPPATPPAGGPGGPGGHGRGERMQAHMVKELDLTADQQTKWTAIGDQERTAIQAIREDTSLPRDQKWAKVGEIHKNFDTQRRAVLTPEQQTKFDEMRAKMRERMRERREGQGDGQGGTPPPPPPPADGK